MLTIFIIAFNAVSAVSSVNLYAKIVFPAKNVSGRWKHIAFTVKAASTEVKMNFATHASAVRDAWVIYANTVATVKIVL